MITVFLLNWNIEFTGLLSGRILQEFGIYRTVSCASQCPDRPANISYMFVLVYKALTLTHESSSFSMSYQTTH